MKSGGGPGVVVTGAGRVEDGAADLERTGIDAGRLRRMDRFGRSGFLAGSLALFHAGFVRPETPDARSGVVFGTAFGCRDSITEHDTLLAASSRVEDLAPAVFAETVHNTVNGELAIAWRLGGVSETLVSGRTAGLEALLLAADRIEGGAADRIVAGGAEGVNSAMRDAWSEERKAFGERGRNVELQECGAALVLEREDRVPEVRVLARYLGGTTFFEPDLAEAFRRLGDWARGEYEVVLSSPDLEERPTVGLASGGLCLEGNKGRSEGTEKERLSAAGPYAIAQMLLRAPRPAPSSFSKQILFVSREPGASIAAVALEFPFPRS